ncbi:MULTISPECIES: hypothetical protein [Actinomadura]
MTAAGSKFVTAPRTGNYGRITVFSTSRATAGSCSALPDPARL